MPRNLRQFASASIGHLVGATISIAGIPLVARLYTPDDFGVLAEFTSALGIFAGIAAGRFDIALLVPKSESRALSLAVSGIVCSVAVSLVILGLFGLAYVLFRWQVIAWWPDAYLVPFVAMAAIFSGVFATLQSWHLRNKRYREIAFANVDRAVLSIFSQLTLFPLGALGLIVGQLMSLGGGIPRLLFAGIFAETKWFTGRKLLSTHRTIRRYWEYPGLSVPECLLNAALRNIPILLISKYSGLEIAGLVFMAIRIASIPAVLISDGMSRVYAAEIVVRRRNGSLGRGTRDLVYSLAATSVILYGLLWICIYTLSSFMFGHGWDALPRVASWLLPSQALSFVASPVTISLHARNKVMKALSLQAAGFLLVVGAVFCAIASGSDRLIEAYSISLALFYLICLAVYRRESYSLTGVR